MSQFVKKASSKIDKMSNEQILRIIETQTSDLRLRNLALDNSYIGYMLVGDDGGIAYFNRQAMCLVPAYKRSKGGSASIRDVIASDELLSFMQACLGDPQATQSRIFEFDDPGSGKKYINCMTLRPKDFDGVLFNFSDVTYFQRFKEEFRKNESLASMSTMAAGVAHEIKNPLASISIYLQLLDRALSRNGSIDKETADKYLSVVKEEVERLNSIAVDFLFAVKPLKVSLEKVSPNDIVERVVKLVAPELEEKAIALDLRLATSMPSVMLDPGLMQQALLNLVKNAMQAMDGKDCNDGNGCTGDRRITISSYIDGGYAVLSVADTGCGMTEDQMEKVFEPYFTTKSNGTGLGLTILFKIVKELSGDVNVRSTVGEGSEFTIRLPIPKDERFRISAEPNAHVYEEVQP